MSQKKRGEQNATEKIEEGAIEAINRSDEFIRNNRKTLIGAVVAVLVVIGGIIAYQSLYKQPRVQKSQEAIYKAEHYFGIDSFALALNGNGADVIGFLGVIDQYGNTASGNLAQAYAGICYYHLGDFETAIKHLKSFKSDDVMVSPTVYGLIGDCYVDMGRTEEAVKYFETAAQRADNDVLSPLFLIKAGIAHEALGKSDKAKANYQTIIDKYYTSPHVGEAQKMIQALELK
ncbi:MAG: tetratricopeptide repeat protein [Porphyromonas sp.]|nr:tetratricopeptide repeat protein [Porphyromonas sp.]